MQHCGYGVSSEMWLKGTRRYKQNFNIELQCKLKLVAEMFEINLFVCKMENKFCTKNFWRSSIVILNGDDEINSYASNESQLSHNQLFMNFYVLMFSLVILYACVDMQTEINHTNLFCIHIWSFNIKSISRTFFFS